MAEDSSAEWERHSLIRSARQHLESLARAGLDRVPKPPVRSVAVAPGSPQLERLAEGPRPSSVPPESAPSRVVDKQTPLPRVEPSPLAPVSPADTLTPAPRDFVPPPTLPAPSLTELFGSSGFDTQPIPACDRPAVLSALAADVSVCCRCPHLAETRTQTVFGIGNPEPRLMFIGEAPGFDEDRTGEPFVGKAGQLLTDMITKGMGLSREQVYIANILKCRPPENRNPTPEETNNCFPYLEQQISIIRPEFICLLGKVAAQAILNTTQPIGRLRGRWHRYRGIPSLATYHPSYLLRTPSAKKDAWEDLQILMKEMGLARPQR